ncbi:MAG TPA: DUF3472 domain-containing protein [Verrucomicrobiae bacterium]
MKSQFAAVLLLCSLICAQAQLNVPAFTAYLEPDPEGANVSSPDGVSNWNDPAQKVNWFGEFKATGGIKCSVLLRLPAEQETLLRLTVAGTSHDASAKGAGDANSKIDFGAFEIPVAGYQRFELQSLNPKGRDAGNIRALVLDGSASTNAHFNLKERRNAASVHLNYPVGGATNVDAFYCEVTSVEAPIWTYFEACGWHRGYFGMQVNSPTERRIIFSVWDSGKEHANRNKVAKADRVTLIAKGDGVFMGDFGNEGTGGHSHFVYDWKMGEKQRFLVTAKPSDATHTIYSGYWFRPDQQKWMLISSWKAPQEGGFMHGFYSFSENFGGDNGELRRKALYGNQWFHTADGQWHEQVTATFSHDPTGKIDRLDRFMGVEDGQFFLSNGGFIPGYTKFGELFHRPTTGQLPNDLNILLSR